MVEKMAPVRATGTGDPGWEHGVPQDDRKKKVKCNYCGKIMSGGIYRLKQHLARVSGEVTYCKKAPDEVYQKMKENLEGCRASKKQRQSEDDEQQVSYDLHSNDDEDNDDDTTLYRRKKSHGSGDRKLVLSVTPPLRSLGFSDPGWEHGVAQDARKKKVKCNYCEKVVSGGINRFKQHLARIPGEVAYCKMAPEEVYLKMKENMKWHRTGRRRRTEAKELAPIYMQSENEEEEDELTNGRSKEKQAIIEKWDSGGKTIRKRFRGRSPGSGTSGTEIPRKICKLDVSFLKKQRSPAPQSFKQVQLKPCHDKKIRQEITSAICKFFYHAAIPFHAANSPYFQKMLDLVGQHGQGLKAPSSRLISGRFLQDEVVMLKEHINEFKISWAVTGCTIMADSWKDVQGKTLIIFLVSCPRGTCFWSSVDASEIIEDAPKLFQLLDNVVEEVGEENVVQVITHDTASYRAAGEMLEEKRKNLFWTPCAVYCIDRMLEDFNNIKWVRECMDKGQKITRFIYNRTWLLCLMKKYFTGGMELLRPASTKFTASFATLQNLLDHRANLKRMFSSEKWISSRFAQSDEGKEIQKIILNFTFWKKMFYVKKSVEPILQVLLKLDGKEGLSMPSIYNDMYRAKLAIKAIHADDERKYGPFLNVIDNHWTSLFHHPLYVAAYFLNPQYRYRPDFIAVPEVIRGLNYCIVRLEPDTARRVSASMQISDFNSAKADFGTELAISTRAELDPAAWWQQHGINCLELQRIAIHILSQTCSSTGCEHNWSTFDQIHNTRHNHSAQKRLKDLMYVHYNLRLREHQSRRVPDDSISFDNFMLESLLYDWVVETEKPAHQEDEEILYNEVEQVDAYENEANENDDLDIEARKSLDITTLTEVIEPSEVHLPVMITATDDDDADLVFLDDELSD
ncbi:hypothetical protein QJS10_CPB17g00880 [Acorus calamus]|uniref:BED-type domain-containing protein n=1 Tax=Acorus calamus TaxID=4465 RepID=A0AAV9CXX4_ACOCL|nr:hypothetical protein QJS10_CPB17g00880 [Acorus calamus]